MDNELYLELLNKLETELVLLEDKPDENVDSTLKALWHSAYGNNISAFKAAAHDGLPGLNEDQEELLKDMVKKRLSGVPLAHITKRQYFLGNDFKIDSGHYIPRKDTELLAETAIGIIRSEKEITEEVKVIDVCTGIGTVALAIAMNCENAYVYGSDILESEILCANTNKEHLNLQERAEFYSGDLLAPFEKMMTDNKVDIIVSAPPFITSKKVSGMHQEIIHHEPKEAFDAGPFGLSIFLRLINEAHEFLKKDGYFIMECGVGQGDFLAKRISMNKNYHKIREVKDEKGQIRVVLAQCVGKQ